MAAAACPAYPWPAAVAGMAGPKAFMQQDCAACHSMLPFAGLHQAAGGPVEAQAAEIVVVHHRQEALPETEAESPLHGAACPPPDLTLITKMLRRSNLYSAQELKKRMALPTPACLQLLQRYTRAPQTA